MTHSPSHTLVYDGQCRVCQRAVAAIISLDPAGAIEVVASQDPGLRERFPAIRPAAFDDAMHLIDSAGKTWIGAAAVEELLRLLPRTRWFGPAFHIPLVRGIADWTYRWVARNRYRLGCGAHCVE